MTQLIIGANGQLGQELSTLYPDARLVDYNELDISDTKAVEAYGWKNIDTIINAAAYTQVDQAQTDEGRSAAWKANATGVANLAAVAIKKGLLLVHVSTDYVFDGTKTGAYLETDTLNPQSVYGASKAAGDLAVSLVPKHYIVRTSWVIGKGKNFVHTMLTVGAEKDEVEVVGDQIGRPTFAVDLARAILHLEQFKAKYGIYNFSNAGEPVSWAKFTKAIFKTAQIECAVKEISTTEFSKGREPWAPRPANSVLDLTKIEQTGLDIRDWYKALDKYIASKAAI